ncbi:MAG: hypothetical protein K2N49_05010 [Ruminococcus sp.]|nr:hypothetical protein [Ruminococcus sp.]MDE7226199.1 hypothetical protein [Ruminococcus sp.]
MFGLVRKIKREVFDRTVYMEVFGDNRISYRVTVGRIIYDGNDIITYGIEIEDSRRKIKESIPDFSRDIEDAVDFAEMLISDKVQPNALYAKALNYLYISI